MKRITSLLLVISMAFSLCGCRFENESAVTDVTTETTSATTISETTSATTASETTSVSTESYTSEVPLVTTEASKTLAESLSVSSAEPISMDSTNAEAVDTDSVNVEPAVIINYNAPFPANAVFLDEIYLELPSPKDGSYLEQRNSLPQSIIDAINKYGDCYLYDTRNRDYWYETDYAIRFFPYELSGRNNRQIYAADMIPTVSYSEDKNYETLYEVTICFDKNTGIISIQGYNSNRNLVLYDLSSRNIPLLSTLDKTIISNSVDITDNDNQHILHVVNNYSDISHSPLFFSGTFVYDSNLKEIAAYHLGHKMDAKPIDLSNIEFSSNRTNLFNYPFLDNDSNLMFWQKEYISHPYIRDCEEISRNIKQEIGIFFHFPLVGGDPSYHLYEEENGTYLIVRDSFFVSDSSYDVYTFNGEISAHFVLEEYGRCFLEKELLWEDIHLTTFGEYVCYIPEENRSIELLNSDFSYSEIDEKIEEILKYSES